MEDDDAKKIIIDSISYEELLDKRFEASTNYAWAKSIYNRYKDGADGEKVAIIGMKIDVSRKEKGLPPLGRNERLDAAKATAEWSEYLDDKRNAEYWALYYEGLIKKYDDAYMVKQSRGADKRREKV